ncbi:MAG TPA: HAMP domain-containing sensor histidine kinase [bacterium]|nr:HAMP domain-containing sensor histidine kinase [bacterium]
MPLRPGRLQDTERPVVYRTRAYVFVAVSLLAILIFLYTNSLIRRLEAQSATLSRSIAGLCATATYEARENEPLRVIFSDMIEAINFPIVISDVRGIPITWKGVPVDVTPDDISHEEYISADPANLEGSPYEELVAFSRGLDERHDPIPMTLIGDSTVLGYIHYGESSMIREMRYVPALELAAFGVLVFLGFLGFRNAKLAELRSIWVGLAKETAHQLGTPISSLMGWVELIKESALNGCPAAEMADMTDEMQRDLERLRKISLRFNQIGSIPKTKRQDLVIVLRDSADYLRRRLQALRKDVEIVESYGPVPPLEINRELMEWVVENLVKNSMEALPDSGGRIEISTEHLPRLGAIQISVKDNGKGMTAAERRRVFVPGYSTKRKGWGLGLALARRIIEEYHKGKLTVSWSEVGQGTTFVITLPTN